MNIDATGFTEPQGRALLDLLLLGMYTDGHLASAEDATLHQLLETMGAHTRHDQDQALDAAVTRIRQQLRSQESTLSYIAVLAQSFPGEALRQKALKVLEQFLVSDESLTPVENEFLAKARNIFALTGGR